jgi:hypothetical protein
MKRGVCQTLSFWVGMRKESICFMCFGKYSVVVGPHEAQRGDLLLTWLSKQAHGEGRHKYTMP